MDYLAINVRPRRNRQYCFLRDWPEELQDLRHRFGRGKPLGAEYPRDTRAYMSDREPGMELPSLIGNTRSLLIVDTPLKATIESVNEGPTEYLPLQIYNHKKRLASDEYFAVHPLGVWDSVDLEASEIEYHEGKVVAVDRLVLDRSKLDDVPDLFRVREDAYRYIVSERLWTAMLALEPEPTNLEATKLDVAGE
ncbi:MAG: DUF1629 domain-containing protein [Planctomycetota bacterium]